jgi:predicted component of type VI protein secretion system
MSGRMDFDLGFGVRGGAARPRRSENAPFRLLLIGNLSDRGARANEGRPPLRRPLVLDAGEVEQAPGRFEVTLSVEVPGAAPEVARFECMDDFHPDRLFARLAAFEVPRQLRAALASPAPSPDTFAAVEAWLQGLAAAPAPAGTAAAAGPGAAESTEATLERLLGHAPAHPPGVGVGPRAAGATGAINDLLAEVVKRHVTPDVGARRTALLSVVDEVLTRQMRALLGTPRFRALEGLWRGVDRVARSLDTDTELQIALLDADRADLAAALPAPGGDLEASPLHRLLVADEPRGWSLLAVETPFDRTRGDLSLLASLAAVAARAGAALLADPLAVLPDGDAAFWQALRESPLADRIGLGFPRVLARLPYGKTTDPISSFSFEELPPRPGANPVHRVWGSAAFALAQGLGAAFRADGWELDPGAAFELDDLPAHTYDDDGESRLVPTTEVAVSESAAAAMRLQGLTPFVPRVDRASARCPGISSIAISPAALSGPWSTAE